MQPTSIPDMISSENHSTFILEIPNESAQTTNSHHVPHGLQIFWKKWYAAFTQTFPVYLATHIAFFVISCFAVLFTLRDYDPKHVPLYTLWQSWYHWDTGHYMGIVARGYSVLKETAFFPLYPLLVRGLTFLSLKPFIAGLIISNLAGLIMLIVLYQLVLEDFGHERASRTILYLSIFPTAFFFVAAYNETLFLGLALLSFYALRHGQWWLAGCFGLLGSLTRSAGLFLILPFCYEYLRQHQFDLKSLRLDVISMVLVPVGTGIFSLYCYYRFGDFLAFSHAQAYWYHHLSPPWSGITHSVRSIATSQGLLSFQSLRNLIDLVPDLFVLGLLILGCSGPWRFPRAYWAYLIYGASLYLFLQLFPIAGSYPLQSASRYMLEIFPAFIVLAALGKYRFFNFNYLAISGAGLSFLLALFLIGHWII